MIERTCFIVKPDGVFRGLVGKVMTRIERAGYKIVASRLRLATEEEARAHYFDMGERYGQEMYDMVVCYLRSGPIVTMVLEGQNAIAGVRKLCGDTDTAKAAPGTIRGDFAHSPMKAVWDERKEGNPNLVHSSSGDMDADREIKIWFPNEEDILSYGSPLDQFFNRS